MGFFYYSFISLCKIFFILYTYRIMITQELLNFIKQEQEAGMTKDQISQLLQSNGWHASDVEEAFVHLAPPVVAAAPVVTAAPVMMPAEKPVMQPVAQPVTQPISQPVVQQAQNPVQSYVRPQLQVQPQVQPQPQVQSYIRPQPQPLQQVATTPYMQPATAAQATRPMMSSPSHSFRNPSLFVGLLTLLITSVIGAFLVSMNPKITMLPISGGMLIGWGIVVLFIGAFVGAAILNMITRIFDFPNASLGKASVFEGIRLLILVGSAALVATGVPGFAVIIVAIILLFIIFCIYYQVTFLKSLYVVIFGLGFGVFIALIVGIIAFALGVGSLGLLGDHFPGGFNLPRTVTMNQVQTQVNSSLQSAVLPTNVLAVNPADVTLAEQAFPAGIPFPDSTQLSRVSVVPEPLSKTGGSIITMMYSQNDIVQNLATEYSAALKKDGYTVAAPFVGANGSQAITASKMLAGQHQVSAGFFIGQINGVTQVTATITQ